MSRSNIPNPEDCTNDSLVYDKPGFNPEVFYERATNWGATPLQHIPEQNSVCDTLVRRIDDWSCGRGNPMLTDYMRTVYYGRFHVRQERNYSAYISRLNQTSHGQLRPDVRERLGRSMVGLASIRDAVLLQNDLEMGSNELARKTHPFHGISGEYEAVESEIYEACIELDPDTYVPDSEDRVKIRGSDMITVPVLKDGSDLERRQERYLFVTKKSTIAVLPHSDTVVVRRQNYILDLDELALSEPNVVKVLRSYDVKKMGPDEWSKKLTELWRDIDASASLINDQTRGAFKDLSTTYYTVNKFRIELIRMRDENGTDKQVQSQIIQEARDAHKARRDGTNA